MIHLQEELCLSFFSACERGCLDCLKRFVQDGNIINIHQTDDVHRTPLHYTVVFNHPECTRYLLELGADPYNKTIYGRTVAHTASAYGSTECLKLLLARHSSLIMEKDEDGWTPFHHACRFNHVACVKVFLEYNANPLIKENKGRSGYFLTRNEPIRHLIGQILMD
jgi:ankyrin repeat protein